MIYLKVRYGTGIHSNPYRGRIGCPLLNILPYIVPERKLGFFREPEADQLRMG